MEVKLTAKRKKGNLTKLANGVDKKLYGAVEAENKAIVSDFLKPTETWKENVHFDVRIKYTGDKLESQVSTDNKIYVYLDKGIQPHIIQAKPGKHLFFALEFQAKTKPGSLSSGPGSVGSEKIVANMVNHPGTKPRRYSQLIYNRAKPRFIKRIRTAIKQLSS